ncbi:MAG: hypothetical protein IIA62_04145 [Nitrospinae bacterium]|nr:hypothetical protein [Nitrospinota bacterium]
MKANIYRNPFIMGLWAPAYLLVGTTTILNDFLLAAMFIMATLAVFGAYVSEFPIFSSLYMNEMAHKTAISSLMGMVLGLMLFLIFTPGSGEETTSGMISAQGQFMATWGVMSAPAYPLMVFLVMRVNKRNLEEEDRIRQEKKKKRKSSGGGGGPPIMDRDTF